jgi:hypothetical protein
MGLLSPKSVLVSAEAALGGKMFRLLRWFIYGFLLSVAFKYWKEYRMKKAQI